MYARGRHLWRGKEPFSAEEKDEIRRRYAQGGVSQREMAVEFDCSRQAISLITRGEL
jgi:transposase-like protein